MVTNKVLKFLSHITPVIIGVILLTISIWTIKVELSHYPPSQIIQSLQSISYGNLGIALLLTIINYFVLSGYDVLALQYVNHPLPYYKTAFVAVIGYGISNIIGFALLSGGAIRYRFYSNWGVASREIANMVAFSNLGFWIGLFAVGGLLFIFDPANITGSLNLGFDSIRPLGVIFIFLLLGYLLWSSLWRKSLVLGTWVIPRFSFKLSLGQIIFTALDWGIAALLFHILLPNSRSLPFFSLFEVYILGQFLGLISHIPGGLGVFEGVMLRFLSPTFITSNDLFATIIVYRTIFYFIPLLIALALLAFYEIKQRFTPKPPTI